MVKIKKMPYDKGKTLIFPLILVRFAWGLKQIKGTKTC